MGVADIKGEARLLQKVSELTVTEGTMFTEICAVVLFEHPLAEVNE